mgnify:CR=1 FL=1|tara:strand:- start:1340 stop:1600 length:261 start_codon:yes stop_codon:yes gene_type:complete
MDELMDMIVSNESPSQISDAIKDMLYAKSAEKISDHKSTVASSLFGEPEEGDPLPEVGDGDEPEAEIDTEVEAELDTEDEVEEEEE